MSDRGLLGCPLSLVVPIGPKVLLYITNLVVDKDFLIEVKKKFISNKTNKYRYQPSVYTILRSLRDFK